MKNKREKKHDHSRVAHLSVLTLKTPQLQHHGAALQVVEQTLGGVEGGEVNSVVQARIDVVPHSRSEQRLAAAEHPESDTRRRSYSLWSLWLHETSIRNMFNILKTVTQAVFVCRTFSMTFG